MDRELRQVHGCDLTIALTHQIMKQDQALLSETDVSIVLGGHEHDVRTRRHPGGGYIVKVIHFSRNFPSVACRGRFAWRIRIERKQLWLGDACCSRIADSLM